MQKLWLLFGTAMVIGCGGSHDAQPAAASPASSASSELAPSAAPTAATEPPPAVAVPVVTITGDPGWSPTMAYILGPVDSNRVTLRITSDKPGTSCADAAKSAADKPQIQMRIFYSNMGGISTNKIIKASSGPFDNLNYALQWVPKTGAPVDLKGNVTFSKAPRKPGELAHFKLDISGNGHAWKGEADALVCASESDLKL